MGICILVFIVLFIFAVLQRGARLPSWCRRKSGRQIFFVLLGVNSLACYLFYVDNHVKWMDEGGKVERNTYGAGIKSETLLAEVEGREIPVTVELEERQYKDSEIQDVFQKTMDELDTVILGNNKSFDEVREDLRLPSKLPGSPITISWECDNYEVLNILGELQREAIPEEGALVEMRGTLKYLDEEEIYIRSVRVLPPDLQGDEKIAEELKNEIKKMSDRHPDESEVALPSEWEGQQIRWKRPGEQRGYSVLVLGMTVGLLMALMEREKQKEEEKKEGVRWSLIIRKFSIKWYFF